VGALKGIDYGPKQFWDFAYRNPEKSKDPSEQLAPSCYNSCIIWYKFAGKLCMEYGCVHSKMLTVEQIWEFFYSTSGSIICRSDRFGCRRVLDAI